MLSTSRFPLAAIAAMSLLLPSGPAAGAEGASSLYLPGLVGDILVAIPPEPGFSLANSVYLQTGSAGIAVLQRAVNLGLDLDIALDIVGGAYTFESPILGGTYTIGAAIPFGYAELGATIFRRSLSADSFDLADIVLTPFQLNWSSGNLAFRFAETIIVPVGAYDVNKAVNLGRNYWGFDTTTAVTYFNAGTGTEVSIAPGILANTRNDDTDYRTGTEFHVDFTANQFLSETFAIGIKGYYYKQITGDSGSGAQLGDFKGEALGIGPGFVWLPKIGAGKLSILGKWMTDIHTKHRFDSDYGTLTISWTF